MIKKNEIEFKTFITKEEYEYLLNNLNLNNNTFIQINYYFESKNNDLSNNKSVLRIRQKENNFKLTTKYYNKETKSNIEKHILLDEIKAFNMINNGFDASIIDINHYVYNICSLKTIRAKINYKTGLLFLDKNEYNNKIDYELEYEALDYNLGVLEFNQILDEFNLKYKKSISKFQRALKSLK